ncbi:MAG: HAMP domain-containing sensor histidine kinase [Myxococcota bacterium]
MELRIRSLRWRTLVTAMSIAMLPLIFVLLTQPYEWVLTRVMIDDVVSASAKGARIIEEHGLSQAQEKLAELAESEDVWLRVWDGEQVRYSYDATGRTPGARQLEDMVESQVVLDQPRLRVHERERAEIPERQVVRGALETGYAQRWAHVQDGHLLVVEAAHRADVGGEQVVVYAVEDSVRGVRMLEQAQYPVFKLVFQVLLVSIIVGIWLGWWSVRPIERLREQVRDRAEKPVSTESVQTDERGEIGDLAEAFNALLDALEQRRRENEAFMADMAHEVKNPVAAIRTAAERLETGEPIDADRAERLAKIIDDSGTRLETVVGRFLELARAEAGLHGAEREPVRLDKLTEALVETFRHDERYDCEFVLEAEPIEVEASSGHLESALRNLIENAASFAESRVTVTVQRLEDEAVVIVEDDGPGIDEDDLLHVFDRFYSRRHDDSGTGLGLAITRAVARAHGGEVEVESEVGVGTTFRARFGHRS